LFAESSAVRRTVLWLAAILVLTFLAYFSVLQGEFQFDDDLYIKDGVSVSTEVDALTVGLVKSVLSGRRALTDLTFALNYRFGGMTETGYHLVNLLLHLVATLLVYKLARHLFGYLKQNGTASGLGGGMSLFVAAVFALHPIQTGAVAYIIQRAEILGSIFYLTTLFCLLRCSRERGTASYGYWFLALLSLLSGWVSKQIVVTVPLAALVYAVYFLPREQIKRMAWACAPVLAAGVIAGTKMVLSFTAAGGAGFSLKGLDSYSYFLTQLRVWLTYLRLIVLPVGQNVDYDYAISHSLLEPAVWISALFWAGLLLLALMSLRFRGRWQAHWRLAGFGLLWFLLLLAPTSTVIPLADVIFEHRPYLAMMGVVLTLMVLADLAWLKICSVPTWNALTAQARPALSMLCVVVVCVLAVATWQRNGVWQTKLSLWQDAAEKSPNKWRPRNNLGNCYLIRDDYENAVRQYRLALAIDPEKVEPYYNIYLALTKLDRPAEAFRYYQQFVLRTSGKRKS